MKAWHQLLLPHKCGIVITSQDIDTRICLGVIPTCLNQDFQHLASLAFSVPPSLQSSSTGILTCFPSATLLSLALGADSPCDDYRGAGNLGLSACGFFSRIIVTHVSIRTSDTSSNLYKSPSQAYRTLSYHILTDIRSFGVQLSPVTSSAQDDSISELLRFL